MKNLEKLKKLYDKCYNHAFMGDTTYSSKELIEETCVLLKGKKIENAKSILYECSKFLDYSFEDKELPIKELYKDGEKIVEKISIFLKKEIKNKEKQKNTKIMSKDEILTQFTKVEEKPVRKRITPYYLIDFTMDGNDGDYVRNTIEITEEQWKNLHPVVLLGILYFNTYGEDWKNDKNGFGKLPYILCDEINLMCSYADEWCHSYESIDIEYFDENNIKYNVILPRINDIFKNVEEMVLTINEYMEDYIEKNPDIID